MKKSALIITFLSLTISCFSQKSNRSETELTQKIDNYIKEIIEINEIPGTALAAIKDGKVIFEKYYGKSSLAENLNISENSVFRLYSTTKIMTTVSVFQLIERNQLSLDDKISKYLDNLPTRWQDVRVKNLLTHSSGLPDIVKFDDIPYALEESEKWNRLYKKPIEFEIGNHFSYNQTNYCLLTKIIEKITGATFEDYVLKGQFPTVEKGIVFSANSSEFIPDRVDHHRFDFKTEKYKRFNADHGKIHNSGSGLNITLKEFIAWNERLDKNILLSPATKNAMWSPFPFKDTTNSFLYGWDSYETNKIKSFGFSGGNMTAFRKFIDHDLTIIFLSNGYKNYNVEGQVIDHVAGIIDENLRDSNLLADEKITADFYKVDIAKAIQNYYSVKSQYPTRNFENRLLSIGYNLMNNQNLKNAIKVFELNLKENPNSANAYDCMAEAYFTNEQFDLARQNYQKSLDLYPENTNAKDMINKIDKIMKK